MSSSETIVGGMGRKRAYIIYNIGDNIFILLGPIGFLSATRASKNIIKPQKHKKTFGFYMFMIIT